MTQTTESVEARLARWATGGDTGSSSEAIAAVMTGNKPKGYVDHPLDGGDLGRCIRLLDLIPEWKVRLSEMASFSEEWAALVQHWDELVALRGLNDGRRVYDRMKAILDPIEAKNPNVIKLGGGASIRFGR
jgi:hypothetical protein